MEACCLKTLINPLLEAFGHLVPSPHRDSGYKAENGTNLNIGGSNKGRPVTRFGPTYHANMSTPLLDSLIEMVRGNG
jgi:hypothetical protein